MKKLIFILLILPFFACGEDKEDEGINNVEYLMNTRWELEGEDVKNVTLEFSKSGALLIVEEVETVYNFREDGVYIYLHPHRKGDEELKCTIVADEDALLVMTEYGQPKYLLTKK